MPSIDRLAISPLEVAPSPSGAGARQYSDEGAEPLNARCDGDEETRCTAVPGIDRSAAP